ncbi:MAG TPA: ATP-binding protein [Vicinamibacteria bacterium]|nr:ATP-binding protein [Vicinamibacteria bacterium]
MARSPKKLSRTLAPRRRAQGATPSRLLRRFRMPSRRTAIAPAVERIVKAVKGAGLSHDQRLDLAVALAEALSNAAVHGNRLRPASQVGITVRVTPRRQAVVEIKDSGHGFDLQHVSDPTDPSHILRPAGRGVFLMHRLVDQVEYDPPGNRVRLVVRTKP